MNRPRFSIVIPTRQRARTLEVAIKTCLAQSFDDYEIVVADNASDAETKSVVERFASGKIRYHRSETPLAMSLNWEVGVDLASGEYITVIGDDDALLLHGLSHADRLISDNKLRVLQWPWVVYNWPDYAGPEWPNRVAIPLPGEATVVNSQSIVNDVVAARRAYLALPMIYNSFVHRDILMGIKTRAGRLFGAISPDVYSGFAVAMSVDTFVTAGYPLGIAGRHSASNGEACQYGVSLNRVSSDFVQLNTEARLRWHPNVPELRWSLPAVVADSFASACNALRCDDLIKLLDRRDLAERISRSLIEHPYLKSDDIRSAFRVLEEAMPDQRPLIRDQERRLGNGGLSLVSRDQQVGACKIRGLRNGHIEIDGRDFGLQDCLDVAKLVDKLLAFTDQDPPRLSPHSKTAGSQKRTLDFTKRAVRAVCPPICWEIAKRLLSLRQPNATR